MTLRVSIIIPTYNRSGTLRRAIRGVTEQSYQHWEIIVVDDGSPTPVRAIVDEFKDGRIRYCRQVNAGPGAARRRGVRESTGDILCFLDDDDYYLPHHLRHIVDYWPDRPTTDTLVITGMLRVGNGGSPIEVPLFTDHEPAFTQFWANPISLHPFALPGSVARRHPPVAERSPIEDLEWMTGLLHRYPLQQLPLYTAVYVHHDENRTNTLVDRASLYARENVFARLRQVEGLLERIGEKSFQSRLAHQRLHWVRQCIRGGQLRDAMYGIRRAINGLSLSDGMEWLYTLKVLAANILTHPIIRDRVRKELAFRNTLVRERMTGPLIRRILERKDLPAGEALILAATPRSGSTWLMEILQQIPGVVPIYEPLHREQAKIPKELGWGVLPVLDIGEGTHAERQFVSNALRGQRLKGWTYRFAKISKAFKARFILAKFVRANLLLGWLLEEFTPQRSPIVLLRHPLSTALSQQRSLRVSPRRVHRENFPEAGQYERYFRHQEYLDGLSTDLEILVARWCLDNSEVLDRRSRGDRVLYVFYERLLLDPSREIQRVLDQWKLPGVPSATELDLKFDRPSVTDHRGDYRSDAEEQLWKGWHTTVQSERERVQAVLDHFGVTIYTCERPEPVESDQAFPT